MGSAAVGRLTVLGTLAGLVFASCGGSSTVLHESASGAGGDAAATSGAGGVGAGAQTVAGRGGGGIGGSGNDAGAAGDTAGSGVGGAAAGSAGVNDGGAPGGGGIGESGFGGTVAGSGGDAGAFGGAGDGAGPMTLPPGVCPNPEAWGPGLEACNQPGGFVHRPVVTSCPLPERNPPGLLGYADEDESNCERDDDCPGDEYCIEFTSYESAWYDCFKPCVEDTDCGPGALCACGTVARSVRGEYGPLGVCRRATCTSDSDCGPDSLCRAASGGSCDSPSSGFACQRPADQCSGRNECPDPPLDYVRVCGPSAPGEAWTCGTELECY
jgi:hypothetical protein